MALALADSSCSGGWLLQSDLYCIGNLYCIVRPLLHQLTSVIMIESVVVGFCEQWRYLELHWGICNNDFEVLADLATQTFIGDPAMLINPT
jgi:hypothetical protein